MQEQCEKKYRAVLEALPDLMFLISQDGTFLEHMAGQGIPFFQTPDDIVGKTLSQVMPAEVTQIMMRHIQNILKTKTTEIFEFETLLDTTIHDFETRLVISDNNHIVAIFRDITERKRSERLKNEFVSIVSHELRTPLTSIRGSLSLILGTMVDNIPPKVKTMVEIAHKNSERLVSLVNDILDIDKIESGKMEFDLKPIELIPLVEQAIEVNRAYAEQFGVSYTMHTDLLKGKVYADSDRLMQVMANLLSNATKFSPRDSTVLVSITQHNTKLRVSITDTGPGIPDEFRSRIFQKFAQADSSDTRQKGGSGLGLSITRAIIEKHNGIISFDTKIGEGTTFFFELPEWQEEEVTLNDMHNKPRILICEDTPDLATMLSMMLNYGGFHTDIAYNTKQARQFLAANQYAAMTLDLVMPGQSGIDFIRELRSQEHTRHLPIVVVSAIAQQGKKELEGGAFGVADWLDKTVDHAQLTLAIRRAINQRKEGKPQVLHIEDDTDVQNVVSAILETVADISKANTIQDARKKLQDESFDLVILDLGLPDGSGLELLPMLRDPSRRPLPVLIFSAQEIDKDTAHNVAATLVKSRTSNQELLETIRSLI